MKVADGGGWDNGFFNAGGEARQAALMWSCKVNQKRSRISIFERAALYFFNWKFC